MKFKIEMISAVIALALLLAASIHAMFISDPMVYRTSILADINLWLMFCSFGCALILFFKLLISGLKRKWDGVAAMALIIVILLATASTVINEPTLVYIT